MADTSPTPEPGPGMVLSKVIYCSICGSEVERVYGPHWDTATEQQLAGTRGAILGHEHVARIEALGEGVTGLSIGDRVVDLHLPCGNCYYCRRGLSELSDEALSTSFRVWAAGQEAILMMALRRPSLMPTDMERWPSISSGQPDINSKFLMASLMKKQLWRNRWLPE